MDNYSKKKLFEIPITKTKTSIVLVVLFLIHQPKSKVFLILLLDLLDLLVLSLVSKQEQKRQFKAKKSKHKIQARYQK